MKPAIISRVLSLSSALLFAGLLGGQELPELAARPDSLFFRAMGSAAQTQEVVFAPARTGATVGAFTVAISSNTSWLSVTPTSGSGAGTLRVTATPGSLASGRYSGSLTINATGFKPKTIPVSLTVMGGPGGFVFPALIVAPDRLKFKAVQGGASPDPRDVALFSMRNDDFEWTATSTQPWLKVTPTSGRGRATLRVEVVLGTLTAGEYEGRIDITSGANSARVNVELEVDGPREPKLLVVPQALNFIVGSGPIVMPTLGRPPESRTLEVKNTGSGTLNWTAKAVVESPAGGTWLKITPESGSTPGKISVNVAATGLNTGTYAGKVEVTSGTQKQEVKVYLRVLGPVKPSVAVSPRLLKFSTSGGTPSPASRTITLETRGTATGLTFTAKAVVGTPSGGGWFTVTPTSGPVPGTLTVALVNASLPATPGVYHGAVEVKVAGAMQETFNVMVILKVYGPSDRVKLEAEPGGLMFSAMRGGSNPTDKKVTLRPEGATSIAWTAAVSMATPAGGSWLSALPLSGTATASAPSEITVKVNVTGLAAGIYAGTIVVTPATASGAAPVRIHVGLVVGPSRAPSGMATEPAAAAAGPLSALFLDPPDGFEAQTDVPLEVRVQVLDSAGAPVEGATVVVDSSNSEPNMTLTDMGGGVYSGLFRALGSGTLRLAGSARIDEQSAAPFSTQGEMESGAAVPVIIFQDGAVSAASFAPAPTPLAPGSLVSLFGSGLMANSAKASAFPLPTDLSGVRVTIGGISAPLLAAAAGAGNDQINLQVPFELDGVAQAEVVVNNNGALSAPEPIAVGLAPAIFTLAMDGAGPGAILHASDFALVSSSRPAVAGEVLAIYATGLGAVDPPLASGMPSSGERRVKATVQVTIGGQAATVEYAGLAPGFAGLYQLNVRVPAGVAGGDQAVVISVDGTPATGRATARMQ